MPGRYQEPKLGYLLKRMRFQRSLLGRPPLFLSPLAAGPGQGCVLWASVATPQTGAGSGSSEGAGGSSFLMGPAAPIEAVWEWEVSDDRSLGFFFKRSQI